MGRDQPQNLSLSDQDLRLLLFVFTDDSELLPILPIDASLPLQLPASCVHPRCLHLARMCITSYVNKLRSSGSFAQDVVQRPGSSRVELIK